MSSLTHLDDEGRARMIDVGGKPVTRRVAVATGRLDTTPEVVALLVSDGLRKADALATARIAGIQAAKRTSDLIPLAHLLPLDSVVVEFEPAESSIGIRATVAVTAKTGVEMEALTAVAVAGLTLHDMVKAIDPGCVLGDIRLASKTGGKHGHWTPDPAPVAVRGAGVVLVSSTGAAAGSREDRTGPVIVEWMRVHGYAVDEAVVVPDIDIERAVAAAVAGAPTLLVTTGGTGIHPQDRTPEATRAVLDRELPGIAEAIRAAGRAVTPTAALSRALAGIAGTTIVVNLPGSPGGVKDGLAVLQELLPHVHDQLGGGAHEEVSP
ncbi:bifunctional molybdenum cofactor biosynthesis protein MoaC/MoaB [Pseudolysinimonas sp.]